MTRAARRAIPALLAVLAAALLSLALFAGPALAADETEEDHGEETTESAETEAAGFGTGQWDGLVLAAVAGVIVGVMAFSMSNPGEIHKVADHH